MTPEARLRLGGRSGMSDHDTCADEREPLLLTPRQQRALLDVIDQQIAIDESRMFSVGPTAEERDEALHGTRLPIQDGDGVLYPIACRRNVLAQRRGESLGGCRWVADDSGIAGSVSCTTCGKTEGPGMSRQPELREMVDGTWSPLAWKIRTVPRAVTKLQWVKPSTENVNDA
jgi:hypothetical protein